MSSVAYLITSSALIENAGKTTPYDMLDCIHSPFSNKELSAAKGETAQENIMSRFLNLLIAIAFGSAVICGQAIAQTQPATKMAPAATTDKAAAKKKVDEDKAMKKQKETECKKKAKEQKISRMKNRSFMKDCMAK